MDKTECLKKDARAMSSCRKMMRKHKATLNWELAKSLFCVGCGRSFERCAELGLDPDSNETDYFKMIEFIEKGEK